MGNDLIDRKVLIEIVQKRRFVIERGCHPYDAVRIQGKIFREAVDSVPSVDAVEVIRCKDCKYFTKGMAIGMCKYEADKPLMPIRYDDFCSYGERRTE